MMETFHDPLTLPGSPVSMPPNTVTMPISPVPMQMPTDAKEVEQPTKASKRKPTARNLVLRAIRQLKNTKGSSFADIKKYLCENYDSNDISNVSSLKSFLEDTVARGILEKINSRYKIRETATRRKTASTGEGTIKQQLVTGTKKETSTAPKTGKGSSKPTEKRKSIAKEVKPEAKKRARKAEAEHVSDK